MTLKFTHFVELLERLEQAKFQKAISDNRATNPDYRAVREWFRTHNHRIARHGSAAVALLSCLFPERLSQRTYNLREQALSHVIPRVLTWGSTRAQTLRRWKGSEVEFAVLVESEMKRTETASPRSPGAVMVEEVDAALLQLAANSPFSGPGIRAQKNGQDACDVLRPIFRWMKSHEAKWLVRLLLKDFRVIQIPERVVMESFHFLLPDLLTVINDFGGVVEFLGRDGIRDWPLNPPPAEAKRLKHEASRMFQPQLGTLVPRKAYDKARSIKHAMNLAKSRTLSVERKYDGEYCQVHIQRSHDRDTIQIFSKSGKDSTMDREGLHRAITRGLDLAGNGCKIKSSCILEGELLVWSKSKGAIEPFYKIRNHVKHGRRFLGNANDPPRDPEEQLMVVFYDVLILDSEVRTTTPHRIRRQHLKGLIKVIPGVSDIVERQLIDFNHLGQPRACTKRLREIFAHAIARKWEGLVLKGRDDPYLSFGNVSRGIKLKKDYLAQLGDAIDLCVIGARLDSRIENPNKHKWNVFYLACLDNKEAVQRFGEAPSFSIIDSIRDGTSVIPKEDLSHLNAHGAFCAVDFGLQGTELSARMLAQGQPPAVFFRKPFVVECFGAGFDKNSNCPFWTLRFPRLRRIHYDRPITHILEFSELQELAEQNQICSDDVDEKEVQGWITRLTEADGKKSMANEAMASQSTASTTRTPHSATTASLSPTAPRNRPPSLPLVWKDTGRSLSAPGHRRRVSSSQNTASTPDRTPSTPRALPSTQPARLTGLVPVSESGIGVARLGVPSTHSTSPTPLGADRGKKRLAEVSESAAAIKRPRLVAGRTVLETPTPPRDEIDLTRNTLSISPAARPKPIATCMATRLNPDDVPLQRGAARDLGISPIPIPLAKPSQAPIHAQVRRWSRSSKDLSLDGATESPQRRIGVSVSSERSPLAEMPRNSPAQRAPAFSPAAHSTSAKASGTKESNSTVAAKEAERRRRNIILADPKSTLLTPPSTEEAARKAAAATSEPAAATVAAPTSTPPGPAPPTHPAPTANPALQCRRPPSSAHRARPLSHKARLQASRLLTSPPTSGPPKETETHTTAPPSRNTPLTTTIVAAAAAANPQPGTPTSPILRLPSAISALASTATPHPQRQEKTKKKKHGRRTVFTDSPARLVECVLRCVLSPRLPTAEGRKLVVLVDSCADPSVVAQEVLGLARHVVRGAAVEGQGEGKGIKKGEQGGGVGVLGKVMICVFDWRVLGCLKEKKKQKNHHQKMSLEGVEVAGQLDRDDSHHGEREGTENEKGQHEHFVCAIHVGGEVFDQRGNLAARVVWRS